MRETLSIWFWLQPKFFRKGIIDHHLFFLIKLWGVRIFIKDSFKIAIGFPHYYMKFYGIIPRNNSWFVGFAVEENGKEPYNQVLQEADHD